MAGVHSRTPSVLKLALYGHPDVGAYQGAHSESALISVGVTPLGEGELPCCYRHADIGLTIYVVDTRMTSTTTEIEQWRKFMDT